MIVTACFVETILLYDKQLGNQQVRFDAIKTMENIMI